LKQNLHGTILEGKSIGLDFAPKNIAQRKAHELENQNAS
jgi:hypothetical protein